MTSEQSNALLRIAMPRKGRIAEQLKPLCQQAGYSWPTFDNKALIGKLTPNIEVMFVRTSDIPALVEDSVVDLGITGTDVVEEAEVNVQIASPLDLFKCRLVLAAREKFKLEYEKSRPSTIRVATSFPKLATKWANENNLELHLIPLSGSVEIAPRLEIADAIIDLTQTGSTLRTNGLHEIEKICDVSACIIAAPDFDLNSDTEKAREANNFSEALVSVLTANGKRYMMMNVPKNVLDQVKDLVPGLEGPTVLDLYENEDRVALHVVIKADQLNAVIPKLRELGVKGILVTHIERLIL